MGQQKGNPTPSFQNQAYENLRPNTGARDNRDMGSKPIMIDDTNTLQQTVVTALSTSGDQSITGSLFINRVGNASHELSISSPGSPPFGNSGESFGNTSIIRSARNLHLETYGWNNSNDSGYHGYTMNSGSFYVNSGSLVVKGPDALVILPTHAAPPTSSLTNPWGFGVPKQPPSGALYFNTTNFQFHGWNGVQWQQFLLADKLSIVPYNYNRGPNGYDTTTIITNRNLSIETYGWNNGNDSGYHGYTMNSGSFYVNSGSLVVKGPESLIVVPNHSNPPTSSLTNPWGFGVPNQPPSGALYFNTTNFNFYGWTGAQWKQLNN